MSLPFWLISQARDPSACMAYSPASVVGCFFTTFRRERKMALSQRYFPSTSEKGRPQKARMHVLTGAGKGKSRRPTYLDEKGDAALTCNVRPVLVVECQVAEDSCCTLVGHCRDLGGVRLGQQGNQGRDASSSCNGELVDVSFGS